MSKVEVNPISIHQKMVGDAVRIGATMPFIHALTEFDITQARVHLRAHRRSTGEHISLSAYILLACAKAVEKDTSMQSMKLLGNKTATFREVDFFVPMESLHNSKPVLTNRIIRNAPQKSLIELTAVLKQAVQSPPTLPSTMQRVFLSIPWFLRSLIYRVWMSSPQTRKKYFGTVYFSSILNYSMDRRTWGIPIPMHSLGLFIGMISKKLVKQNDQIESRDMVQVTLNVDHRVNNGGDMGRFLHRLKYILENQNLLLSDKSE